MRGMMADNSNWREQWSCQCKELMLSLQVFYDSCEEQGLDTKEEFRKLQEIILPDLRSIR